MGGVDFLWLCELASRELMLFAAVGLLIGGIDDLAIDLIWLWRSGWRRLTVYARHEPANAATLPAPVAPGRIAVFVAAWDEGAVIGEMLRAALTRFRHDDYRIYVGVYPNDPGTMLAVGGIFDARIRMVGGMLPGPTSKAECLNRCFAAMAQDEAAEGVRVKAVVLHDAEDVVHPAELAVFDRMIERFDLVQLPVLPLVDRASRWVAGHYCDEFAEAHGKQLVVREALGAAMPLAGVGCAISRAAIDRMAAENGGAPFNADSLTEDYEIGLRLGVGGGRAAFVRLPAADGRGLVAVRAYFPATIETAVRQKARWLVGIALQGWDRLGWQGGWAETWMRLRDRRAIGAALVLCAAYGALLLWFAGATWRFSIGDGFTAPDGDPRLLLATTLLLVWRIAMRGAMVARVYGWREGLRAMPRTIVGNIIAIMAARRALAQYLRVGLDGRVGWDKTRHHFPSVLPAE